LLAVINDAYGISLSAFRVGVVVNFKKAGKLAISSDVKWFEDELLTYAVSKNVSN
jgi:hypothetical protein